MRRDTYSFFFEQHVIHIAGLPGYVYPQIKFIEKYIGTVWWIERGLLSRSLVVQN